MVNKIIVISDAHISAPPLDDFDSEIEAKFIQLTEHLGSISDAVELIINGDFLDFVQAAPAEGPQLESVSAAEGEPLCFTEACSAGKLQTIYSFHSGLFHALSRFLQANPANRLTVLPGNHDPDLFWPSVESTLRSWIGASAGDRFKLHLERSYIPDDCPGLWIEHGHQFDKINSFFVGGKELWSRANPPILADSKREKRLVECLGTRFLIRFLNRLDKDYPFVDNVKPFSLFVRLFAASALVGGKASLRVAITMWKLLWFLTRTGFSRPGDLLSADTGPVDFNDAMRERLQMLNEKSKELQSRLHRLGFMPTTPLSFVLDDPKQAEELMNFLSEKPELLDGLDSEEDGYMGWDGEEGTLSLARGFRVNETQELINGAAGIIAAHPVKMVVMGHTHEPQDRPAGLPYLNTGSWTRYYKQSSSEKLLPWSLLKAAQQNHFPYALKYAEIQAGKPECAELKDFV
ncbi:MAG: metallophosphoesterase [Bryobacterales bacterium]|nr:metallophosphoesterase [Bryobacterales bacterium]MBV9401248.1 metallophosphoesterase [Bryobacterales bacterium]